MAEEKEAFLDRWSRLKQQPEAKPAVPEPKKEELPPAPLPAVDSLKADSDFKPFMASGVAPETRRAALKKMFTDAHFSTIDPFEPYSIDLTGEDPIPEEMLKTLKHAKRLLFDEKQQPTEAQPQAEIAEKTEPDVAGKQDT